MAEESSGRDSPHVLVLADDRSNAEYLIERVLQPAGIRGWIDDPQAPTPDILLIDVTQLRGDPFAELRRRRANGDETPAIVLAAHIPATRLRDLFRLGVADILLKPFRPVDLGEAIYELGESRSTAVTSQLMSRKLQAAREESRKRSEEIRLLSEIGRVVVNLPDLDEILKRVVEAAAFMTGAEEASIYLAEPGEQDVVLRASKEAGESRGSLPRLRVTDTLAGVVYSTGQPVLRQPESERGPVKVQTGFLVESLIKVPIRVKQEIVGVLGVYNRIAQRKFSEHHLTLLMALADWAGVALEQAGIRAALASPGTVDTGPIASAPPQLVQGLEEIQLELDNLLDGGGEPLTPDLGEKLRGILARLQGLGELPIALLEPGQTKELVDMPGILMQIVKEYRSVAAKKRIELISESSFAIPLFAGNHNRTRQVIQALVEKAIHRTRSGRIILQVRRFEMTDGKTADLLMPPDLELHDGMWVAVRVADTSSGLSPDTVRALSNTKADPDIGKIGPGLSMGEIRLVAESLGGALWYDQTPASTSITMALPIS